MMRLRRFLRLPITERWLLIKAALLLWTVKLGLVLLPFRTLRRSLDKWAELSAATRMANRSSVEVIVWAVETAGRYMPRASTCLTQALTAHVLLQRRGHPALLHIGVVKKGEQFLAHAWVESRGKVVIGDHELDQYTTLTTLAGATA